MCVFVYNYIMESYSNDILFFSNITLIYNKKQTKFDIIFCDPPYHQDLCLKVLQMLHEYPLLTEDGIIIMEHAIEDKLPSDFHQYTLLRNQKYGSTTQISIYELKSNKSED